MIYLASVQYNLVSCPVCGFVGSELAGDFGKRKHIFRVRIEHIILHLSAAADVHLGVHDCFFRKMNLAAINPGAVEMKVCCM
ncbi:hypothetical protein D3C76_1697600 [compost metagenome]